MPDLDMDALGEVEVKYRLLDPDEEALAEALAARGVVLGDRFRQDDQAYAPASWSYGMPKLGVAFARLRSEAGRVLLTVKVPRANELDCAEQETFVEDRATMHEALLLLDMVPTVRIAKFRRTGAWGKAQLCLDVVDGLGIFIELERVVPRSAAEQVQAEMDQQVRSLGLPLQRVTQTYDSLLRAAARPAEDGLLVGDPYI
ncbi:class IV adenylate cyclase [Catellatospora methionotrophica]|uniref:class IV adenylate cyclase n=1 Tax=Catellatospora methionotrophica TaxID=121620 RepID=UPI0033C2DBB0